MRPRKKRPNWPYLWTVIGLLGLLALYIAVQTLIGSYTFARRDESRIEWGMAFVSSLLDATVAAWFVCVGASIGSFINVIAYRLPLGKTLGGHSQCPFCDNLIDGRDNIPALSWIKLRGRCRDCRLPISAQYPIVEFAVALVFFVVYSSEFLFSGGNLPGVRGNSIGAGAMTRISVSAVLVARLITYVFALSALISAALIAVRNRSVPIGLYLWALVPYTIAILIQPSTVIIRWRTALPVGPVEARLDAFTSMLCGMAAGIALARLLAPLVYQNFDRSFFASDRQTTGARQFLGAMAVTGGILGWQAVVPFGWVLLVSAILSTLVLRRYQQSLNFGDLTVWVWLGLLVFRASWKPIFAFDVIPEKVPDVMAYVAGALALAGLAILFRTITNSPDGAIPSVRAINKDEAYDQDPDDNAE
ncbi:MAG: prepilin peptidase [Aureliella sp.]